MSDMAVFRGNDIVFDCLSGWNYWTPTQIAPDGRWIECVHMKAIEPGDYVAVEYETGDVGGGYHGLTCVSSHILVLKECIALASPEKYVLRRMQGPEAVLSNLQRQKLISHFRNNRPSWYWDNATAECRAVLTGEEPTAPEKARTLVLQASARGWCDDPSTHAEPSALLRQAIELYPEVAEARVVLGKMAISRGRVEEAIAYFAEEISKASKPDALNAHSYLAIVYRELGREGEAQNHARAAMETPEYRQRPTQLSPEAVKQVIAAVHISKPSGDPQPSTQPMWGSASASGPWWRFWT